MVPDYTTLATYTTKEPMFLCGAAPPPSYISLAPKVFSHELLSHDLESDESLRDLELRVVEGVEESKEFEGWYHILSNCMGTEPDASSDLFSNAHSRDECLADPQLPRRGGGVGPAGVPPCWKRTPSSGLGSGAVSVARNEGSLP